MRAPNTKNTSFSSIEPFQESLPNCRHVALFRSAVSHRRCGGVDDCWESLPYTCRYTSWIVQYISMYMYIYMYIYICIYIYVYIYVYMYIYILLMYVCTHMYIYIHTHTDKIIYIYTPPATYEPFMYTSLSLYTNHSSQLVFQTSSRCHSHFSWLIIYLLLLSMNTCDNFMNHPINDPIKIVPKVPRLL